MRYIFIIVLFVSFGGVFSQGDPLKRDVFFASGSHVLSQESLVTLFELSNVLKESPYYTMVLTGHTDNSGNGDANQKLSENRVVAVRNYLLQLGLNGEWISTDYFGANQPMSTNRTEEGKHYNRRVEVSVYYYPPSEPKKIKSEVVVPPHRQGVKGVEAKIWE